ncbi:MAG: CDP-archaeol synthase [Clostridia bacterium]|nr:CDP-archaeol synthase [Clostridia bacterium]MBQ8236211.1 CDP-archaeol synthase [Clostridia bacterium]MBQ8399765.1 CDP-archaeol synthase [Clostridia bacterium]
MKTRVITGIVGLLVFVPLLVFSNTYAGCLMAQLLCLISVYELSGAVGLRKKWQMTIPLYLLSIGMPLLIFFEKTRGDFMKYAALAFSLAAFYLLGCAVFSKGKIKIEDTGVLFTMQFYVFMGFNAMYMLRHMENGGCLIALLFISPWATDIFAYFTGRLFGKHKLIPDVSPKKTVEGAVGGFVMAIVLTVVYGLVVGAFTKVSPQYLQLVLAGAVMSVASMVGDLIASLVKRHYGIKDYSRMLPGHGGILDRFDSILAASFILLVLYELPFGFSLFV